jgi:transposase
MSDRKADKAKPAARLPDRDGDGDGPTRVHRDYDEAFKGQAVRMVTDLGRSMREVSKGLGVPGNTLRYWVRLARRKAREHDGPASAAELAQRVAELERQNARLLLEREILKKATAFFASQP